MTLKLIYMYLCILQQEADISMSPVVAQKRPRQSDQGSEDVSICFVCAIQYKSTRLKKLIGPSCRGKVFLKENKS